MILGIDTSTYFEEEEVKAKYYRDGKEVDPLKEFRNNNVSHMRIRIWNDPYSEDKKPYLGGTSDLDKAIRLSKIASSYGYKLLWDFHYSDFWADPGKQICPKAWKDLTFEQVCKEVYKFTKECLIKAKENDLDISLVQIGNEITNGMIWPFGKLDESTTPRGNYEHLSLLLKEGVKAAREVFPKIKIIIHLERSYDQVVYAEYFDHLKQYNVDYDIIGMSYYPYWHGTFKQFFANVNMCQQRFNKDVMVMELGYSFTLEDYILNNNGQAQLVVNGNSKDLISNLPYPITKQGQAQFIEEFLKLAKENNVKGVFYWEPMWIPCEDKICWASKEGQAYIHEEGKSTRNEWSNQCLFDYKGEMNPSFDKFKI